MILPTELTKSELYSWTEKTDLDSSVVMQRKMDGVRAKIVSIDGEAKWYDRNGAITIPPKALAEAAKSLTSEVALFLDGEIIGDIFYIFDVVVNGQRKPEFLDQFPPEGNPLFKRVPKATASAHEFLKQMREANAEGVVFREYPSGKSHKFKFVKQADCIVIDKNVDGKANLELAVWDDKQLVSVGMVSALTGDGPSATIGNVVTVNYLYSTNGNRLYQPTKPMVRTDKAPEQCTIDQLEATRKGTV